MPDEVFHALSSLSERAQAAGVALLLENEHICYADTGRRTAEIVRQVSHPALKVNWDPGNSFAAGEVPFPDAWQRMKPWAVHVHIKDAVKDPDAPEGARCVPVGDGGYIDYVKGANIAGFVKVADAMLAYGVV